MKLRNEELFNHCMHFGLISLVLSTFAIFAAIVIQKESLIYASVFILGYSIRILLEPWIFSD